MEARSLFIIGAEKTLPSVSALRTVKKFCDSGRNGCARPSVPCAEGRAYSALDPEAAAFPARCADPAAKTLRVHNSLTLTPLDICGNRW